MTDRFEHSLFGMRKPGQTTVKLGDMYSPELLRRAQEIWATRIAPFDQIKDALRDEIVKPRLAHINQITGQENDPDFLAYQLIYVLQNIEG